jgi:hypothetical protein
MSISRGLATMIMASRSSRLAMVKIGKAMAGVGGGRAQRSGGAWASGGGAMGAKASGGGTIGDLGLV